MTANYRAMGIAIAIAGASFAATLAQSGTSRTETAHREILVQATQSWNGKPYMHYPAGQPELTTIRLTIAPHTVLPWHTHPIPNVAYVLSGSLTVRDQASGKTQTIHQGQAFAESVDTIHRGESGDEPTVLLITYAGSPGIPTSIPAKGEKDEY
jgi:quercetin dioxygenase-like cupin family protein